MELVISEKWGAYYCNSISLKGFTISPWTRADSDANCRQPSTGVTHPLLTGVTHPLLPSQAITGTVWWENDWQFLSFTCASFQRLTCRTYFLGKIMAVKQWNRHHMEAYRNGMIFGCRSFPEKSSEWRFQRTSTPSSSAEFQKKRHKKKRLEADVMFKQTWVFP